MTDKNTMKSIIEQILEAHQVGEGSWIRVHRLIDRESLIQVIPDKGSRVAPVELMGIPSELAYAKLEILKSAPLIVSERAALEYPEPQPSSEVIHEAQEVQVALNVEPEPEPEWAVPDGGTGADVATYAVADMEKIGEAVAAQAAASEKTTEEVASELAKGVAQAAKRARDEETAAMKAELFSILGINTQPQNA